MYVTRNVEIARLEELRIITNARLLLKYDLNPIFSKKNLRVQFELTGELKGAITCYLCLDEIELNEEERNFIQPLFVESMNILIGKQLSLDDDFNGLIFELSPPKIDFKSLEIATQVKNSIHKYELEYDHLRFIVLAEYSIQLVS